MKSLSQVGSKQRGFTLIEIAIVLVIIGLLVGGVLQGQELINNSRVKQAVKDMNGTAAAVFAYQDRYGRIPGDDGPAPTLAARGASWTAVGAGDADNKVCLSQVPGSAAIAIDTELDDGLGATGRLRATLGTGGANTAPSNAVLAAPYSEDNVYTICYRM